ncbi:MAG: cytochrome D1 domain-containing protein [Pseudomonadota bacterium]
MRLIPLLLLAIAPSLLAAPDGAALYHQHCASCHGEERLGGTGPALLPDNLGRLKPAEALAVIRKGRPATQMAGFEDRLTAEDSEALRDFVFKPPAKLPIWGLAEIEASRIVPAPREGLAAQPVHGADPLNLFVVVETGDHHATILDGDRLVPIHRFPTRFALHGGPKFSPDGRFVYFASRDGWISQFDLYSLKTVAEVRAGINTRNLAISGDGRYVMAANYLPPNLVLLNARDLKPIKVIPVTDERGQTSRVAAVYAAPPRESFIAGLKDLPEIWEIATADNPPPVYNGPMHDYRMEEGIAKQTGPFPVRRIKIPFVLDDFFLDQSYRLLVGTGRQGPTKKGQVIQLDAGVPIAALDIDGMPHLSSGITWEREGHRLLATPNLERAEITVIDMGDWKTVRRISTAGSGSFLRSHERSRYVWADCFFSPARDTVHVIDKQTLDIVKTLKPQPGKTVAHVEFDKDGKYALLSLWEMEGALIVYDATTLEEVKRIPMRKPSGKYNVANKIRHSEGTSH